MGELDIENSIQNLHLFLVILWMADLCHMIGTLNTY